MINFFERHIVKIAIGIAALVIVLVAATELNRHRRPSQPVAQISQGEITPVVSEEEPPGQQPKPPPAPPKEERPMRQPLPSEDTPAHDTLAASIEDRPDRDLSDEVGKLQRELDEVQRKVAQLRGEEDQRARAREERLTMMEDHVNRTEALGNTLRQVLKNPRQIRIMATDLQNQASGLRSQIESGSETVDTSPVDREIRTKKRSAVEQQAADLEDLALKLQRTGGEPARVRIIAVQILDKAAELKGTLENARRQKIPPNNELETLEKKEETLKKRIRDLQQQHLSGSLHGT